MDGTSKGMPSAALALRLHIVVTTGGWSDFLSWGRPCHRLRDRRQGREEGFQELPFFVYLLGLGHILKSPCIMSGEVPHLFFNGPGSTSISGPYKNETVFLDKKG